MSNTFLEYRAWVYLPLPGAVFLMDFLPGEGVTDLKRILQDSGMAFVLLRRLQGGERSVLKSWDVIGEAPDMRGRSLMHWVESGAPIIERSKEETVKAKITDIDWMRYA